MARVLVLNSQKRLDYRGDPMRSPIEPVDTIYLRDAIILSTPIAGRFSYMLVSLDDVTGFSEWATARRTGWSRFGPTP